MFFIFSKLLYFIITPIVWFFIAITIAYFTKNKKVRKRIVIYSFIGLYLFSNSFLCNEVVKLWEVQTIKIESIKTPYDYGIVLGGFNTYDKTYDRINFNKASDRLWQTLLLYKQGKIKRIFITGGEGKLIQEGYTESETTRDFLIKIGIPKDDIIIESKSRNTYENAVNTAKILNTQKPFTAILITSAIHMKRAHSSFAKAGIQCDEFSTDRIAGKTKFLFDYCFIPEMSALENWRVLFREITGYYMYKVMGYN